MGFWETFRFFSLLSFFFDVAYYLLDAYTFAQLIFFFVAVEVIFNIEVLSHAIGRNEMQIYFFFSVITFLHENPNDL